MGVTLTAARSFRLPNLKLLAATLIVGVVLLVAIFAPLLAPASPYDQSLSARMVPPAFMAGGSPQHLLGTDGLGRDYASRLIYGARIALMIGVGTALLSGVFGI